MRFILTGHVAVPRRGSGSVELSFALVEGVVRDHAGWPFQYLGPFPTTCPERLKPFAALFSPIAHTILSLRNIAI